MISSENKILTNYDITLIFSPNLEKVEVKDIVSNFISYLKYWSNDCTSVNYIGRRTLAYPIKKYSIGVFVNLKISASPNVIVRLQETFRQEEGIVRSQIIKL